MGDRGFRWSDVIAELTRETVARPSTSRKVASSDAHAARAPALIRRRGGWCRRAAR
ncbi:DUF6222 family protein [Cellulomonas wangleii]|uniref:DUF6222 family protein n=1 Tax=Cellulomonas wangleii TaxID=2816956 RepID=UPI003556BEA9